MHNWAEICSELKDLEKRVDIKVGLILSTNPDPFPFDRLQKAREIASLSKAIRLFIEEEQEKDAAVLLHILQGKGVKLKSVR
ncbi:hypothetical protein [Algoriphagus aquimarinus]|uniref:hypothetical protein n=1 Tax=Algoriphagus aquimarinus TaxID=237018 RepID=UPI0030DC78FF|tara:strand:- start:25847 stop:26092 length:246 start_codon:yes stop_codon:yes gene_type:complete